MVVCSRLVVIGGRLRLLSRVVLNKNLLAFAGSEESAAERTAAHICTVLYCTLVCTDLTLHGPLAAERLQPYPPSAAPSRCITHSFSLRHCSA